MPEQVVAPQVLELEQEQELVLAQAQEPAVALPVLESAQEPAVAPQVLALEQELVAAEGVELQGELPRLPVDALPQAPAVALPPVPPQGFSRQPLLLPQVIPMQASCSSSCPPV